MDYVGTSIGAIRIESRLGQGGMGEVYLGFDPRLERRVAVKTIRAEKRLSPQLKARFLREARLLSKLGHPSICQVYDLIETPDADFLVLEYVQGTTLRRLADRGLPFERKIRLAIKIATALAAAHREKIVHRDLKADNVMVTPADEVKVLDFGIARSLSDPLAQLIPPPELPDLFEIAGEEGEETHELMPPSAGGSGASASTVWLDGDARLTREGTVMGTPEAMSPEQATGGEVTEASDLYSFGILLHELFTGQRAYEAQGRNAAREVLRQVTRAETQPIEGLDPDLTRLIQDLESLDPRRRPTAEEAGERLRWILDKPQRQRRQRLRLAAVASAFAFLVAVLAVVSWLAVRAERARREADQRRQQAESLIGFMLGDLRTKLEAVNRLDILDAVGDRSLAYFDGVSESQLTDDELSHRIAAIAQIGEVRYAQGDLAVALEAFRKARELAASLTRRDSSKESWQSGFLEADTWLGQVLLDQGKPAEALKVWRENLRLTEEQRQRHPGNPEWAQAVATGHHNVGTLLENLGDLDGALKSYRASIAQERRLAAADPKDLEIQAEIAGNLAFVSNCLERQGDLAGALKERREYVAIQERLAESAPGDPAKQFDRAVAHGFLASLLAVLGDPMAARDLYEKGLADMADLAAHDPGNATWQRWLAAFHSALGALRTSGGDPEGALQPLGKACRILESLVAKAPTSADWRLQLGICRSRTAAALENLDLFRARVEAKTAGTTLAPLLQGQPDEPTRGLIADAEVTRGRIEAALGHPDEARKAWEQALAILAPCPRPLNHWKVLAPWTEATLRLGRAGEARLGAERLERMGYQALKEKGLLLSKPSEL